MTIFAKRKNGNFKDFEYVIDLEDIITNKTCSSLYFYWEKWNYVCKYVSMVVSCSKTTYKVFCKNKRVYVWETKTGFAISFCVDPLYIYHRKYVLLLQVVAYNLRNSYFVRNIVHIYLISIKKYNRPRSRSYDVYGIRSKRNKMDICLKHVKANGKHCRAML